MRLAIADPPYLGRARRYAGGASDKWKRWPPHVADHHPEAAIWDDPATHRCLIRYLMADFDGWAVALSRDSLPVYLAECPDVRVAVWHNPNAWPPGGRIHASWEPVLVWVPQDRRAAVGMVRPRDVLTAIHPGTGNAPGTGFVGAKPRAWTRWVLDMLGYQESDEVVDLFPGSGAVGAEIAQQVLPL